MTIESSNFRVPVVAPASARRALDCVFAPRNVAIVGATETVGSVGRTVLSNLLRTSFGGPVYAVNPKRRSVLGVACYPAIGAVPEKVDLAVVVTPASSVPAIIGECVDAGVRAAVVISAGFKEVGSAGESLEREIIEIAKRGNLRLIGPNCLGVMSPGRGLNATFAAGIAQPGNIAFLSQSGALGTAVLDWGLKQGVGFSAFVSTGSMLDVGWGDLIDYFGDDPSTRSILIYMESVGDVRSFMSCAREVALSKPIIVIKAGRTEAASRAAASHTGALTGSDDVLDAAFRRAGVLRVERISDLFYMAEVLRQSPGATGKRLGIVTNAGGPAVLATDALVSGGGELAQLAKSTRSALDQVLPPHWSRANPVDVLGDANAERYARAVTLVADDPSTDGVLVILTPQDMTESTATAENLAQAAAKIHKPVLASWMGADSVADGLQVLNRAGISTFEFPDSAARAFNYMWRHEAGLRQLYETPIVGDGIDDLTAFRAEVSRILDEACNAGREILTEAEAKDVLAAYGIPVIRARVAESTEHAVQLADSLGYPVVLKLHSHSITHKTDVGGVKLNLLDAGAVRRAFSEIHDTVGRAVGLEHFNGVTVQPMIRDRGYELILGSSTDPQFGPVIMFGLGGQLVEVLKDRALGLPPLNDILARRMMEQTKIYAALRGVRGQAAVDMQLLERFVVRFSDLVLDQPRIKEIEINPLLASSHGIMALDARVLLHTPASVKNPTAAIRPYPTQYVVPCQLRDGSGVVVRPIRPEDEPAMVRFHEGLSDESIHSRYFCQISFAERASHERLRRICLSDYDRKIALVAVTPAHSSGAESIIGVGRLTRIRGTQDAEFAVVVADQWQRRGLGTVMMNTLIRVARDEDIHCIAGDILVGNVAMQALCKRVGFAVQVNLAEGIARAAIKL